MAPHQTTPRTTKRWEALLPDGQWTDDYPPPGDLAAAVARAAHLTGPPVDLDAVVALWPSLCVNVEDLDGTGYLLDLGAAGGEILLRGGDSPARRRFTLAHEIGHWLLATPHDTSPHQDSDVERWCDRFATELLIPRRWIVRWCQGQGPDLAKRLLQLPPRLQASRQASYLRIAELTDISLLVRDLTQPAGRLVEYFSHQRPLRASDARIRRWAASLTKPPSSAHANTTDSPVSWANIDRRQILVAIR